MNPTILLLRLIVLIERGEHSKQCFAFKVASFPTALFKYNLMRHAEKSELADALINHKKNLMNKEEKKKKRGKLEAAIELFVRRRK